MSQNREINEAFALETGYSSDPRATYTMDGPELLDLFRAGWLASQRARERAAFAELLDTEED